MLGWMKHKVESRLQGEISITSDMHTGEGNGNPLQYSLLENPRGGTLVGWRLWGCTKSDMTDMT